MEKLLTIVIPTYNVEAYLEKCLASFLIDEVLSDIEILVIDDASPDRSAEIAKKYTDKYPDVFKLIQKENGGHGSTINLGKKMATGRYFKVVDSDDWVDKQAFLSLVQTIRACDSDIIYSNYYWVDHKTGKKSVEFQQPFKDVEYNKEYSFKQLAKNLYLKIHGLTIKTELVKKIPTIDEHCYYVDMEFVLFPIPQVNTITFIDEFVYNYRIGMSSQSVNIERMKMNAINYDTVMVRLLHFYCESQELKIDICYLQYIEHVLARMFASRIKIYLSSTYSREIKKEMQAYDKHLKKYYPRIYKAIINHSVRILQMSNYMLYGPARAVFYLKDKLF